MEVQMTGQAFTAFLGALGFTRPVEQLMLHSVPLPSLLFWLSQPKGSNLVEATIPAGEVRMTSACRARFFFLKLCRTLFAWFSYLFRGVRFCLGNLCERFARRDLC